MLLFFYLFSFFISFLLLSLLNFFFIVPFIFLEQHLFLMIILFFLVDREREGENELKKRRGCPLWYPPIMDLVNTPQFRHI